MKKIDSLYNVELSGFDIEQLNRTLQHFVTSAKTDTAV